VDTRVDSQLLLGEHRSGEEKKNLTTCLFCTAQESFVTGSEYNELEVLLNLHSVQCKTNSELAGLSSERL